MKKILLPLSILLLAACVSKGKDDPLIVPPNFAEVPDVNNPEKITKEQREENIIRLKELLLESEEG